MSRSSWIGFLRIVSLMYEKNKSSRVMSSSVDRKSTAKMILTEFSSVENRIQRKVSGMQLPLDTRYNGVIPYSPRLRDEDKVIVSRYQPHPQS